MLILINSCKPTAKQNNNKTLVRNKKGNSTNLENKSIKINPSGKANNIENKNNLEINDFAKKTLLEEIKTISQNEKQKINTQNANNLSQETQETNEEIKNNIKHFIDTIKKFKICDKLIDYKKASMKSIDDWLYENIKANENVFDNVCLEDFNRILPKSLVKTKNLLKQHLHELNKIKQVKQEFLTKIKIENLEIEYIDNALKKLTTLFKNHEIEHLLLQNLNLISVIENEIQLESLFLDIIKSSIEYCNFDIQLKKISKIKNYFNKISNNFLAKIHELIYYIELGRKLSNIFQFSPENTISRSKEELEFVFHEYLEKLTLNELEQVNHKLNNYLQTYKTDEKIIKNLKQIIIEEKNIRRVKIEGINKISNYKNNLPTGINNGGYNICYVNCLLQVIAASYSDFFQDIKQNYFRQKSLLQKYIKLSNSEKISFPHYNELMLYYFKDGQYYQNLEQIAKIGHELLYKIRNGNSKPISKKDIRNFIMNLKTKFGWSNGENFGKQQDASELLIFLQNLAMHPKYVFKSKKCKIQKTNDEFIKFEAPDRIFTWEFIDEVGNIIPGKNDLQNFINDYSKNEDIIQDYICSQNNIIRKKQILETKHILNIKSFPKKLIIQAKRYYFNSKTLDRQKSNHKIKVPFKLKIGFLEYELTSFIVQYGSISCGHYTSYNKINNKWFCCNDSKIYEMNLKQLNNALSIAFLLFYSQKEADKA